MDPGVTEEPLHQLRAADAKGILQILVRPGTEAIDGNRKAQDTQFCHDTSWGVA
jgi:hypothetical protein